MLKDSWILRAWVIGSGMLFEPLLFPLINSHQDWDRWKEDWSQDSFSQNVLIAGYIECLFNVSHNSLQQT